MNKLLLLISIFSILAISCKRKYCAENTEGWGGIENCVELETLNKYITDPSLKQIMENNAKIEFRKEIQIIAEDFIKTQKVDTRKYYVIFHHKKGSDSLEVYLNYVDSYVYEYNKSINHNNIETSDYIGDITGKEWFYIFDLKSNNILLKGRAQ
jgi:hypothetical protein